MSEAKKRKVHSPEFKAKVGLEALRGVKTINEIGKLKMELDGLKKSLGSTCHDPARVDCSRRTCVCSTAMHSGRRVPCDGLCTTKASTGR